MRRKQDPSKPRRFGSRYFTHDGGGGYRDVETGLFFQLRDEAAGPDGARYRHRYYRYVTGPGCDHEYDYLHLSRSTLAAVSERLDWAMGKVRLAQAVAGFLRSCTEVSRG